MLLNEAIGFRKSVPMFEPDESMPLPSELMGIEIEVEGVRRSLPPPPNWTEVRDDSLRNHGKEYIFSEPLYGTGITDALMDMSLFMEELQPDVTYRCSVHAHLNVSDMSLEQFLTLLTLYLMFERVLVKYHGGEREDNIFCIPFYKATRDLGDLIWMFKEVKEGIVQSHVVADTLNEFKKYSALNIGAVMTHGSLEFRHMSGTTDMSKVFEWIKIIQHLKRVALEGDIDYMNIINSASGNSSTILERVFRECADSLRYPNMVNDIMRGARLAQSVVAGAEMKSSTEREQGYSFNSETDAKMMRIRKELYGVDAEVKQVKKKRTAKKAPSTNALFTSWATAPSMPEDIAQMEEPIRQTEPRQPTPEDIAQMEEWISNTTGIRVDTTGGR